MKIEKVRENIARNYSGSESTERLTEVVYTIIDDNGQSIGDARAYNGSYSININGNDVSDIAAAEAVIRTILNIKETEE
jgi:hypothetical protein